MIKVKNVKEVKLSPPWSVFYNQIEAMFGKDPDIKIVYDEDNLIIKLYVNNEKKSTALCQLLPNTKVFGNVTLKIEVIPANENGVNLKSLFQNAFEGNPVFSYIEAVEGVFTNPINYVVFKKEVVQYFNDDLGDVHGVCSTLYQEIAKDIFGDKDSVFFCTDVDNVENKSNKK